jgi:hypothetical protein
VDCIGSDVGHSLALTAGAAAASPMAHPAPVCMSPAVPLVRHVVVSFSWLHACKSAVSCCLLQSVIVALL